MKSAYHIPIVAVVTPDERLVVERAAEDLADALSQATGQPWTCHCHFVPALNAVAPVPADSVIITSLGVSLARPDRPWMEIERELEQSYAALCQTGVPVLICTLLRHVGEEGDPGAVAHTRRRIRQLNLLATELSRAYGALIIDLDRVLADIGARRLNTDYRLRGAQAINLAGIAVAQCVTADALDAFVDVDAQQAAHALLENRRPDLGAGPEIMPANMVALGRGRSKQRVSTVTDTVQERHAAWLVRQFLNRQIGPGEALTRLGQAMRRRGARESAVLLFSSITHIFKSADRGQRR
jgi:hypothetical protein